MSVCQHRPGDGGSWVECSRAGGCACAEEVRAGIQGETEGDE